MNLENSKRLFDVACEKFPGGVNSPVRAFRNVGGIPPFMEKGQGAFLTDVDGNEYVDFVLSYGPLILGHADPKVVEAIRQAAARGTSFGMPTEPAIQLAELIQAKMPRMEMLRFVNSGTEAVMSVLRLARAFTGREKVIKFEGCYHGHADFLLVQAGSGVATLGLPDSPGVTSGNTRDTCTAPYNNLEAVESIFEQMSGQVAAIVVEPVAGNMGLVKPASGFLEGLRKVCDQHGALLVFDEVMTGFRVADGGAESIYGVRPDLTALGKVIGGGLPVGAFGGRKDIMEHVAPAGSMYQAGTLSGNPLAMAAGLATLSQLNSDTWKQLESTAESIGGIFSEAAKRHGLPVSLPRVGTMSGLYFLEAEPTDWSEVKNCNREAFTILFHEMLAAGVFLAPSPFEAAFISTAHDDRALDLTEKAVERAFAKVSAANLIN